MTAHGFLDALRGYLDAGGLVMPPLLASAALLWYGLGYRLMTLRRGNARSARTQIERSRQGHTLTVRGVVDAAIVDALTVAQKSGAMLRRRLDEALGEHEDKLRRFRVSTKLVITCAPLLGLLGTVIGMVETFDSLGDMTLFAQSGGVAGGISQALFSTQFGLAVAVPGLVISRLLDRREDVLVMEIAKIKDLLCSSASEGDAP